MALLHSRIGRVFYISHSEDGALGTRYKLHTMTALNHHFDVYHCILPESAASYDNNTELVVSADQQNFPISTIGNVSKLSADFSPLF